METTTTLYQSDEEMLPAEYYVEPAIPNSVQHSEVILETLALITFPSCTNIISQNSGVGSFVLSQTTPRTSAPRRMADDIKMPAFSGNGLQDPEQHMFLCEAIWTVK